MTLITRTSCGCGRSSPIHFCEIAGDVPWDHDAAWEMPVCGPGLRHVSSQAQQVEEEVILALICDKA